MRFFPRLRIPFIKKYLPRTLFGRSLVIILVPALLLQIVITFVFFDRHWTKITSRLSSALAGEIAVIAQAIEYDNSPQSIQRITDYAKQNLDLYIYFQPRKTLPSQSQSSQMITSLLADTIRQSMDKKVGRPYIIAFDKREKWVDITVELEYGLLFISSPERRLFSSSSYIFLLWVIFASLLLFAIAILFMRNQIRPIRRLAVAAQWIGKGRDVPPSFKPEGAHEVRQAAQAFLDMHERVKRQVSARTTMLASISHDLRTPLTRMKLQLAMLPDNEDVQELKQDVADMEKMIDGYLAFAKGEGRETKRRVHIGDLLQKLVTSLQKQGHHISLSMDDDITMSVRRLAFERCISNLLNNAAKYAENVWVNLSFGKPQFTVNQTELNGEAVQNHAQKYMLLCIDDDGPGIPEKAFEDVFKPFTRLDESRNAEQGGVGLGLPIAQDIIHSHGGEIWLEQSPKGGLRVVISLPE